MGKYLLNGNGVSDDSDSEKSGYESDGGNKYTVKRVIGHGTYATAIEASPPNSSKKIVVLYPKKRTKDFRIELANKYNFFRTIYHNDKIELLRNRNAYRLILPKIPGITYKELNITNQEDQLRVFISAIKALRQSHQHWYVVLDLKSDNILYECATGRSYLIDGGLATPIGEKVPKLLNRRTAEEVKECQYTSWHIAPECWSTNSRSIAATSMDVYSLSIMLRIQIFNDQTLAPGLDELFKSCENIKPEDRPTLDELEKKVENLLDELLDLEFLSKFNV